MGSKNQHVQKISKAICKDAPDLELALGVLVTVAEEAAGRHNGPMRQAYQDAVMSIYLAESKVAKALLRGVTLTIKTR